MFCCGISIFDQLKPCLEGYAFNCVIYSAELPSCHNWLFFLSFCMKICAIQSIVTKNNILKKWEMTMWGLPVSQGAKFWLYNVKLVISLWLLGHWFFETQFSFNIYTSILNPSLFSTDLNLLTNTVTFLTFITSGYGRWIYMKINTISFSWGFIETMF